MKKSIRTSALVAIGLLLNMALVAQETSTQPKKENKMQVLIDKLTVPNNAKEEFIVRLNDNRNFIKHQPGFIQDDVFESSDATGNYIFITVAIWESGDALKKAKVAVDAEYQRTGFNIQEFCKKMNIKMERNFHQYTDN